MKLGVFDSGIGGEAVAATLRETFPNAHIIVVNDKDNAPYGTKSESEIKRLTLAAIQPLIEADCDAIIIACNTATAVAIEDLRVKHPNYTFIGIEPMVKTAASLTRSNIIAVCATPATLASARYAHLKNKHTQALTVIEPDCSDWAYMIENNIPHHDRIQTAVRNACDDGADVIVLGCTHYHWIKEVVSDAAAGRAIVIEPSEAIGRRVKELLKLS